MGVAGSAPIGVCCESNGEAEHDWVRNKDDQREREVSGESPDAGERDGHDGVHYRGFDRHLVCSAVRASDNEKECSSP